MTQDTILTPAEIGEYLSLNQCSRFFKHRIDEIEESEHHTGSEYDEAFTPLNLLLAEAGELFESGVKERFEMDAEKSINLADEDAEGGDEDAEFIPDHQTLIATIADCISNPATAGYMVLFQPTLKGEIGGYKIAGHADFVLVWPTDDGACVRVIDAKSTANEKSYQQIQAAIYTRLIEQLVVEAGQLNTAEVEFSAGVVTRNVDTKALTPETTPVFDYQSRIADVARMLEQGGEITTTANYDLDEAPHAINSKCSQCPYVESCSTEAFEQLHLRLLGISESAQAVFESYGITSIEEVASLCRAPNGSAEGVDDSSEWNPTVQKRAGGVSHDSVYHDLKADPTVGDQLPELVYEAQAIREQLNSPDKQQTGKWIPGTGKTQLPEDDPYDSTEVWFEPNSMIRVYLNIQHDHLRNRIIQLNARVSVSHDAIDSIRISELADVVNADTDASEIKWAGVAEEQSHDSERDLLRSFIEALNTAIESVSEQMDFSEASEQTHPLLQFYTYTAAEFDDLVDALDRVSGGENAESTVGTPLIDAFADTLEGEPAVNTPRVAHLKPQIQPRLALPTTSAGLLHVYDFIPPFGDYRKPRGSDEWSYVPPHKSSAEQVDIRSLFNHRLFDTGRKWDRENEELTVYPAEYPESGGGLKTRYRYGAEIPLGYLWAAIGRINEQWIDEIEAEMGDNAYQIMKDVTNYLYHDATEQAVEIQPADVTALGKHMVDMLEHVERATIYRDQKAAARKPEVDPQTLWEDTRTTATIAEAAREYLITEHTAQQQEKYDLYRQSPRQRILSGESLPVRIDEVDTDTGSSISAVVTGVLRFDHTNLFGDNAADVKLISKCKGGEGSSSGDRMVASRYYPAAHSMESNTPTEIEMGVKATIRSIDMKEEKIVFELRNMFYDPGEFDTEHRSFTTDKSQARTDDMKLHIARDNWLILDPATANFPGDKADQALKTADQNAVHELLEGLRWGECDALSQTIFPSSELDAYADWLQENIWQDSYPNDRQQTFITETNQVGLLQGPPGTGKTAGTIAPTICGRLFAAGQTGQGVSGLITAPSNTAIDEMLEDTAELVSELGEQGVHGISPENVNIVRITRDEPDNPDPGVEYLHYRDSGSDGKRLREIRDQIKSTETAVIPESKQDEATSTTDGSGQATIGVFDKTTSAGIDVTGDGPPASEVTHTLVFATPTSAWQLIKDFAGSGADPPEISSQSLWDLLIADEASMLTLPKLILAGAGMKSNGQLLLGGDHRQLPPVQKHDWENIHRQSIAEAAPYLSALNYLRLLGGDLDTTEDETATEVSVLTDAQREQIVETIDPETNPVPLTQLNTTFRFGPKTADFIGNVVYDQDDLDYSAVGHDTTPTLHTADTKPVQAAFDPSSITAIVYDSEKTYQQQNELETTIATYLLSQHGNEVDAGIVTPHNAQRSRLRGALYKMQSKQIDLKGESPINLDAETQVETVNRFQGGQKDIMIVSATASNPQFIRSEADFLLELNRANVAFSRHKHQLIVLLSKAVLSHIPDDPATYDQSLLWKSLSHTVGASPTVGGEPHWSGTLEEFMHPITPPQNVENNCDISIFHL